MLRQSDKPVSLGSRRNTTKRAPGSAVAAWPIREKVEMALSAMILGASVLRRAAAR